MIKHAPNQTQFQFSFLEIIQFITLITPVFRFVPVFQIIPHLKLTILILQLEQKIFFQRSKPESFLQQEMVQSDGQLKSKNVTGESDDAKSPEFRVA